jgi:hypothetical protein
MTRGRVHDWKMADDSIRNSLTEAREQDEEYLNQWVNSHGDTVVWLRTEDRFAHSRYTLIVVPVTETSAWFEGVPRLTQKVLAQGETAGEVWESERHEYLQPRSPIALGYDGHGEFHENERASLQEPYDPLSDPERRH